MTELDIRKHPDYAESLSRLKQVKLRPLVAPSELAEIGLVTDALPALEFPVDSAGELLDQIGEGRCLAIVGLKTDPVRMIKYMPAYYFPISSYENFVEKMAELIRANRRDFDADKVRTKIKEKARGIEFPIKERDALMRALQETPVFNVAGRKMDTAAAVKDLPEGFFPVESYDDLEVKALRYLRRRPLIEAD